MRILAHLARPAQVRVLRRRYGFTIGKNRPRCARFGGDRRSPVLPDLRCFSAAALDRSQRPAVRVQGVCAGRREASIRPPPGSPRWHGRLRPVTLGMQRRSVRGVGRGMKFASHPVCSRPGGSLVAGRGAGDRAGTVAAMAGRSADQQPLSLADLGYRIATNSGCAEARVTASAASPNRTKGGR